MTFELEFVHLLNAFLTALQAYARAYQLVSSVQVRNQEFHKEYNQKYYKAFSFFFEGFSDN